MLRFAAISSAAAMVALFAPGQAGAITSPNPVTLSQSANVGPATRITVSSPPGSFPDNPVTLPGRTMTDMQTLAGDPTLVAGGSDLFNSTDVGRPVSGPGIPAGTTIAFLEDTKDAFMRNNATATGTGLTMVLGAVQATGGGLVVVCNQYVFLLAGLGGGRQLEGCDTSHGEIFGSIGADGTLAPTPIFTPSQANVDTGGGAHPDPTATCPPPLYQTQLGYSCVVYVVDTTSTMVPLAIDYAPIYMTIAKLQINPPAGNGGDTVTVLGQQFACGVTTVRANGTQFCASGENVSIAVVGGSTMQVTATPDGSFTASVPMPPLGTNTAPFKVKITATGLTSGLVSRVKYTEVG
jgi:hypothetical protein